MSPQGFGSLIRRAATSERVQHYVAGVRGDLNTTAGNCGLQFIHMPSGFEFLMACWCRIVPKVCKIEAERIQEFSMSTIVFQVLFAVATNRDWKAHVVTIESSGIALCEVKQGVMRGVQLSSPWKGSLHRHGDPMAEKHALALEMACDMESPLR